MTESLFLSILEERVNRDLRPAMPRQTGMNLYLLGFPDSDRPTKRHDPVCDVPSLAGG